MFDVGFSELILMAIVALVVLGPEKLPHAARVAGAWIGKIKRTVSNMQAEIEREVSAQEMRDRLQKEIDAVKEAGADMDIRQPLQALNADMQLMQAEMQSTLAPAATVGTPVNPPVPDAVASLSPPDTTSPVPSAGGEAPVIDGEAAYREWLESQKASSRRMAPKPAVSETSIAKPSSDSTPS